ncbi:MAG: sensor histidine kinase, partial [Clostridia bacterium]
IMTPLSMLAAVVAVSLFIVTTQSIVRNIKNKTFFSRILTFKIVKFLWAKLKQLCYGVKKAFGFLCGNRISAIVLALFAAYTLLITFFIGMGGLFIAFVIFVAAGYFMYRYLVQLDKIKTGIIQIRSGNTDYKIEGCTTELLANAADALNSINEGVKIGVEREVKAQRMKSELITNVSHDLKTPLTSIISYADLLDGMELIPKEANDYAKIIKQKGDRLKKLTQDLFDISKAESGNESVNPERLDIALLLRQSMAELNSDIEKSGLSYVTSIPDKEIFVTADGKKLSRVFENLLVNTLKYSMRGTRVYVTLKSDGDGAAVEIKNISAEPMNFDSSEITERFVRGDSSRTTEGSGLGLAIAKSYAELCGGSLAIDIDGDLFKATVRI